MRRAGEGAADATVGEARESLLGERRAEQISADPFESGPILGADTAIGVEVEVFQAR